MYGMYIIMLTYVPEYIKVPTYFLLDQTTSHGSLTDKLSVLMTRFSGTIEYKIPTAYAEKGSLK